MSLVDFLRARMDEQEGVHAANWWQECDRCRVPVPCWYERDAEAKRRIIERHISCDDTSFGEPCEDLRLLALPYASHSEYREEWRPA